MRRLLIALLLFVPACGGDQATAPLNINGTWQYTDDISNGQLLVSCTRNATLDVTQNGSNFTAIVSSGTQSCTGPNGTTSVSLAGVTFQGGQITGSTVSFASGTCNFTGASSGNPASDLSGGETCTILVSLRSYAFDGHWHASR
ncbi:MAG TPA: hypothetical protein VJN70_07730 [Gemmatimonadaceae bacterium]|nr:hypothetical protein [Gemmatimonadaceae bacterium]